MDGPGTSASPDSGGYGGFPPPPPPPPSSPGGYMPVGYGATAQPGERAPQAVAALVWSIVGLVMPCLFPASIVGVWLANTARKSYPRCSMSTAAFWVGVCGIGYGVLVCLYFAFVIAMAALGPGMPGGG